MANEIETAPAVASAAPARGRRGRPPRAEEVTTERRRRKTLGEGGNLKLTVNEAELDRENYEYRFIVDRDQRLYDKTVRDDWDIVKQDGGEVKHDASDLGAAVSTVSGVKKDGSPERLYLCRKPRRFHVADQAEKETARRDVEDQIRDRAVSGALPEKGSAEDAFYSTGETSIGGPRR